ncbi:MAG: multidrug efflux RND transporter permease subunit [Proteobacteria bacterium]|nr:multidrug efflux RND transporter permease subunit [Pseudomonadota bacterium]
MPNFFIDRPIFAWVIAILISLGGLIALTNLGVESYPAIAPPQVVINTSYPGADATTVEKSVTQVIEQQLTGIDHLMYFSSTSSNNGGASISLTFEPGTNPDTAAVQTQNQVSRATPRLPSEVVQQGVTVSKSNPDFLMFFALRSKDNSVNADQLNNVLAAGVLDQIARIPGVSSTFQVGAQYAMRIWLDADKLHTYGLSAADALNAVRAQNVQVAAGAVGAAPTTAGTGITATVAAEGRFSTPEQFGNIILRANGLGTAVRLKDVARIELGPESYGERAMYNGSPVAGAGVQLVSGANALTVANEVKAKLTELQASFPPSVEWFVPYDSTTFVRAAIEEVAFTLIIAFVLVFLVMFLFLQNLRATFIATIVVPVALLGGVLSLWALGFTINQLSLFGMVLAIGIVVDDAIVVIENVERIMREEGLSPKDATRKAMAQISGAVVAIGVVLMAVFMPSALQTGSVGAIYRQFALTIALSTAFSAFLALAFTPALCATLIRPTHEHAHNWLVAGFNRAFDWVRDAYTGHVRRAVRHAPRWMAAFAGVVVVCGLLFWKLPSSFVPDEDQGYALAIVSLPSGATLTRTNAVMDQVSEIIRANPEVERVFAISGFSFVGDGENVGMAFIGFKPWGERKSNVAELVPRIQGELFGKVRDGMAFVVNLPTIRGLGRFGGFDLFLQDRTGHGHDALIDARNQLLAAAAKHADTLVGVRPNALEDAPQLKMTVDRVQAQAMGLSLTDVYSAIQLMLAPVYVDDFDYGGRVLRVIMQADAPYRASIDALSHFYVPGKAPAAGGPAPMIPLSNVVHAKWTLASPSIARYNGYEAIDIVGAQAPGKSTGQAMAMMKDLIDHDLPHGYGFEWTGQSLQEILSGQQAPKLFALSILVVFLCLAALYESWSIPVSVMLVVPLGLTGALLATWARGLSNDVFLKVGLITIIGLAAKNAILIVEFAVQEQRRGVPLGQAVVDAARLRLRPILMTSFAFILGVMPLVVSTGAGANARHAIGTGVVGGMLFATVFGVLLIPVFYVVVRRLLGDRLET